MFGMNEIQLQAFVERISATAIANQAILKCATHGMPLTVDNAILFVGDFFDPQDPSFESLILKINDSIAYVVGHDDQTSRPDDVMESNVIRLVS